MPPQLTIGHFYGFCFILMYILSFVFVYQKFSEIVAFIMLFIVHTTFCIYISKDIFKYLTNGYYFTPMFISIAAAITMSLQFIALSFILQLVISLRKKYTIDRGTPIYLSEKNTIKMERFKAIAITSFVLVFIILCILTYGIKYIDVNMYDLVMNITMGSYIKYILIFISLLIGSAVIGISGYQVYLGNDLSKAQYNQILSK